MLDPIFSFVDPIFDPNIELSNYIASYLAKQKSSEIQ